MSIIPKTFVFDTRIPQSEYKKYISPDDVIDPED